MSLSFLPRELKSALAHLNINFLTELRLRQGREVVAEYKGKKTYISEYGVTDDANSAIRSGDLAVILSEATGGCVYNYAEQMKSGFITVEHGVRIGIAGEYVTENGEVKTVKNLTSLNVRIPHDVKGCSDEIFGKLYADGARSTLIFSKPGLGKTTMLRDIAGKFAEGFKLNVLILDERNEIAGMDAYGNGFGVGLADVIRCHGKLGAIASAIRAMKPDVIITDELYGDDDIKAVKYASECGIAVIASSHITDLNLLQSMPFEYFVKLTAIGGPVEIYAKNLNSRCDSNSYNPVGSAVVGGQKEENAGIFRTL